MNKVKNLAKKMLFIALFWGAASNSWTQERKELGSMEDFTPWFLATCGRMVGSITTNPQYAGVLKARSVDAAAACGCASAALLSDERLQRNMTGREEELQRRLRESDLASYFSVKVASTTLACLAVELEKSLAVTRLGQ